MIDNEGIYIGGDTDAPDSAIVIFSRSGKLIVLQVDAELDPTRFLDSFVVKHGPLKP